MTRSTKSSLKTVIGIILFLSLFVFVCYLQADDLSLCKPIAPVSLTNPPTNLPATYHAPELQRPPVITASQIYWITRLDPTRSLLGDCLAPILALLCFVAVLIWFVGFMRWSCDCKSSKDHHNYSPTIHDQITNGKRSTFIFLILLVVLAISRSLLPSTKEMAMIYVTPKLINSEFMRTDLPREFGELYSLAKQYFQAQVEKK